MTGEYTPTTVDVCRAYIDNTFAAKTEISERIEVLATGRFDRWLLAHDAEVAAKAKAEVVEAMEQSNLFDFKPVWGSNERDQEVLRFGEHLMDIARAAALRASTGGESE